MNIIGISAFFHDSAASLIIDGKIVSAAQEERFSRLKFDKRFPEKSIEFCLQNASLRFQDIDAVIFFEKPQVKFNRIMENIIKYSPFTFKQYMSALPEWVGGKLTLRNRLKKFIKRKCKNWKGKIMFSEHHLSHAASAFYPSPYKDAAVVVMDAVGESASTSIHIGEGNILRPLLEQNFPHSLGMLYSAFTSHCGFKVNSGEYKLMGLAPYGQPKYTNLIKDHLININEDGSFTLNLKYFKFHRDLKMTNINFNKLFKCAPRKPEAEIDSIYMDLAASIQKVTEEIIELIIRHAKKITNKNNLCLAGGVALNCVANGKVLGEKIFDNIWVQPAAGDAGGSLGAALAANHLYFGKERIFNLDKDLMNGSLLGPDYTSKETRELLIQSGANFKEEDETQIIKILTSQISKGKIVGLFNGRMEFGPRALGSRSIIGDPRNKEMQKTMNIKVKFRESFRPFAPAVLKENCSEYFELDSDSPYMLFTAKVHENKLIKSEENLKTEFSLDDVNNLRSSIPAVTHIDNSARIQTVDENSNYFFWNLLKNFKKETGCPILINTSFNIRGEPIVCTPIDAFKCFMGTDIDILVINRFIMFKEEQNMNIYKDYKKNYELD